MAKAKVTAEIPIGVKLKHLYDLQCIDSEIDQIHILKGELPMVVSDLEDEIGGLRTRMSKLDNSKQELEKE